MRACTDGHFLYHLAIASQARFIGGSSSGPNRGTLRTVHGDDATEGPGEIQAPVEVKAPEEVQAPVEVQCPGHCLKALPFIGNNISEP